MSKQTRAREERYGWKADVFVPGENPYDPASVKTLDGYYNSEAEALAAAEAEITPTAGEVSPNKHDLAAETPKKGGKK